MRVKFILKGVLLWVTAFAAVIFISGVDSIYDNGYLFQTLIAVAVMILCCYKLISEEEFEILSLYKMVHHLVLKNK